MFNDDSYNPEKKLRGGGADKNKEAPPETLAATRDINPATGEEFWYIRDENTGEKIPINTKEDENGTTRELLDDGTLGREIVQNPFDDKDAVNSLYGQFTPDNSPQSAAEQSLPVDQRTDIRPISLATENLPDDNSAEVSQGRANELTSQTTEVNLAITDAAPEDANAPEKPDEFSEKTAAYREKLQDSLATITAKLMEKADTLSGLNMPDAAQLFATKVEQIHALVQSQIETAGSDYSALSSIHGQYFEGQGDSIISQVGSILDTDPSTIKFNQILSQATTIPELPHIADKLVEARNNLKIIKLEELRNASSAAEAKEITDQLADAEILDQPTDDQPTDTEVTDGANTLPTAA